MRRVWWAVLPVLVLPALLVAGSVLGVCDDGDEARDRPLVADGPEPASMCAGGGVPVVAAYEADTGRYRWVACADVRGWAGVDAATDDRVFVKVVSEPPRAVLVLGFAADGGAEVWQGTEAEYGRQLPDDADAITREPPVVGGVRLSGGQDDPLVAVDAATGKERWRRPVRLPYDDVWAVGDGAVFAVEPPDGGGDLDVVAYEIASGEVRWRRRMEGYRWPWHVLGERLFVLWHNLAVVDTDDGRIVWETAYAVPQSGFPRMSGAVANDDLVFVSFTGSASGGD